jgi:hypothetical protein
MEKEEPGDSHPIINEWGEAQAVQASWGWSGLFLSQMWATYSHLRVLNFPDFQPASQPSNILTDIIRLISVVHVSLTLQSLSTPFYAFPLASDFFNLKESFAFFFLTWLLVQQQKRKHFILRNQRQNRLIQIQYIFILVRYFYSCYGKNQGCEIHYKLWCQN